MLTYADKAVPFTLTLDVDLNLIDDHETFKKDIINDVATAANVNGTQFTCFTSTGTKVQILTDSLLWRSASATSLSRQQST